MYSGGGIEPDLRFDGPVEGFNPTRFGRTLLRPQLFASLRRAVQRRRRHAHRPRRARSRRVVTKDFAVDDAMVADFKKFVASKNVKIDEAAWTKDVEFIRAMIRYEIDAAVFDIGDRAAAADRRSTRRRKFAISASSPRPKSCSTLAKTNDRAPRKPAVLTFWQTPKYWGRQIALPH